MITKGTARILAVGFCALLGGCATSRSEIKLHSPVAPAPAVVAGTAVTPADANGASHVVVIRSVVDERVFEEAPDEPSTPSLGSGGSAQATAAVKERAIARKRNTFGKALGDVLLEGGQTVPGVVRENLTAALQQAGYTVSTEVPPGASATVVDVHIKQFWSWFKPGFWAITLNNTITTDLEVEGGTPVVITTHVENTGQMATDGSWMKLVDQGLSAYRAEVQSKTKGKF